MSLQEQIEEISRSIVESLGAFVVEVNIRGNISAKVIEIFVDTDNGITIDACAEISHKISLAFDSINLIPYRYHLVVSSPGIDRPLTSIRQYHKNIGRMLLVSCQGSQQVEKILGELIDVSPNQIMLRGKTKDIKIIPFDSIVTACVQTVW